MGSPSPQPSTRPAAATLQEGLVALWRAENDARDSIGDRHGKLVGGAGYAAGKVGQAFKFDGKDGGVEIPDDGKLDLFGSVSFALWFKLDSLDAPWQALVCKGDDSQWTRCYSLWARSSGSLRLQTSPANDEDYIETPEGGVQAGKWYHAVCIIDRGTGRMSLILNGKPGAVGASRFKAGASHRQPLKLGCARDPINLAPVGGLMDEIAIWNRPLNQEEALAVFSGALAKIRRGDGPLAFWPADGDANDSVGECHGQLKGGAAFTEGRSGKAFKFDGKDGRVSMGDVLNLGESSWTAALWYQRAGQGAAQAVLLSKGLTQYGNPANAGYQLTLQDGTVIFRVHDASGPECVVRAAAPEGNDWHHVAGVLDRKAGLARLYIDGKMAGETSLEKLGSLDTNMPLALGCMDRGEGKPLEAPFAGAIDEPAVWGRALSAGEVAAVARARSLRDMLSNPFMAPFVTRGEGGDRIALADGNVLLGEILNPRYTITGTLGKRELPASTVAGVIVRGTSAQVLTTDGQALTGALSEKAIELKLSTGSVLRVPLEAIHECGYAVSAARPAAASPQATVVLLDGQRLAIDPAGLSLALKTDLGQIELPVKNVVSLQAKGLDAGTHQVELAGGSVLVGQLLPDKITLKLKLGGQVAVKSQDILLLESGAAGATTRPVRMTTRGGQKLVGQFKTQTITIETRFGTVAVPSSCVVSVKADPAGQDTALKQWDGVILHGKLLSDTVEMSLEEGANVKVPIGQMESLEHRSPQPPPEVTEKVKGLIRSLGSDSFDTREQAGRDLARMGPAIAPLLQAADTDDPEVRQRIQVVLDILGRKQH